MKHVFSSSVKMHLIFQFFPGSYITRGFPVIPVGELRDSLNKCVVMSAQERGSYLPNSSTNKIKLIVT